MYYVEQGTFTNTGVGSYTLYEEFENLEDALNYFNKIKNDKKGYDMRGKVLYTQLVNDDEIVKYWEEK